MDITSIAIGTFIYIIIPKLLDNFKKSVILITQMVHLLNIKEKRYGTACLHHKNPQNET